MAVSAKNFRFVSPGIRIEEIDRSQIPADEPVIGACVIGRARRGPAFVPVEVRSFSEFVQTFGEPVAGGAGGDVWREGNYTSPMYGTYAAQSWLKNGESLNYVRLLGVQSTNKTAAGKSGWDISDGTNYGGTAHGGAYALIVAPSGALGDVASTTLTWYTPVRPDAGDTITIVDTAGLSKAYIAAAAQDLTADPPEWHASNTTTTQVDSLQACIESANGHNGTITVAQDGTGLIMTLTNTVGGTAGNRDVTRSGITDSQVLVANNAFTGGTDIGTVHSTGSVAAIWYLETGQMDCVGVSGGASVVKTSTLVDAAAGSSAGSPEFTVRFTGTGLPSGDFTFSFDKGNANFIRKVFNTDPTLLGRKDSDSGEVKYVLGETYENAFLDQLGSGSSAYDGSDYLGAMVGLASASAGANSAIFQHDFEGVGALESTTYSKSGWFLSQDMSSDTASFTTVSAAITADRIKRLFRFVGLDAGEWTQNNIKVSLTNIRPSINEDVNEYGSFTVQIRQLFDEDGSPKVLETFEACDLNPKSDNYLLKKVGTRYTTYDETMSRIIYQGEFANNSKYIRVEVNTEFLNGFDASHIPYGVTGPTKWTDVVYSTTTKVPSSEHYYIRAGSDLISADIDVPNMLSGSAAFTTLRFNFPEVPTRANTSGLEDRRLGYWGAQTTTDGSNTAKNDVRDLVRCKPNGMAVNQYTADGTVLEYQYAISLDNVIIKGALSQASSTASLMASASVLAYDASSRAGGYSLSSTASLPSNFNNGVSEGYKTVLNVGSGKLTTVFFGGFDGWDITESDPLRVGAIGASKEASYELMTYDRAIQTIKNPEIVSYNVVTIPGLTKQTLTDSLIANTAERADALAVIDIPDSYEPPAEYLYDSTKTSGDYGSVVQAVQTVKGRKYNSSYGCTYYPWVKVRDSVNSTDVWVPPSVVALGAMAYTDRVQAPWFAPAGFNRGGLSTGISGLGVLSPALKLFKNDRNDLYETNVNPIATFPNEGIVIFGQKTLQADRSALDRINVRRLLVFLKRGISRIANNILFEPNVPDTWTNFKAKAIPFLTDVKTRYGLTDYKLILDETTTTPDLIDRNIMYAKLFIKPARAIEYIALDFIITNTGASFDD